LLQHEIHDLGNSLSRGMESATMVSKPNVTTGRTANASRIRRSRRLISCVLYLDVGAHSLGASIWKGNVLRPVDVSWRLTDD